MEKRGVIEDGRTPPEDDKQDLEEHLTKRAAEVAERKSNATEDR